MGHMEEIQSQEENESKDILGGARIVRPSDPDTYSDPESARVRARQLGCIGIRRYNNRNGGVSWMPCTNESDYRKYSGIGYSGRKFRRTQLEREVRKIVGSPSKRKFSAKSANYTNPELRERIKNRIMAGSRGGAPGQWSARKAQLVAIEYRKAGGGYRGKKTKKQRSLTRWTKQKWRTSDGKPAKRGNVTRRYLPAKAWDKLTPGQRAATNRKKIIGSRLGRQFVPNTEAAARARKRATRGAKHSEFYDALETKAANKRIGNRLGGGLPGKLGRGEIEGAGRAARRGMGRIGAIVEPFDPNARDADSDMVVQEGTIHERPAIPGVNPIGPAPKPGKPDLGKLPSPEFVTTEEALKRTMRGDRQFRIDRPSLARRANETARFLRPQVEDAVRRDARRGQEVVSKPQKIERAKPETPRREAERAARAGVRKPINLPKPAPAIEKPFESRFPDEPSTEEATPIYEPLKFPKATSELGRILEIEQERLDRLRQDQDDFPSQLSRKEKAKFYHVWHDGEYSLDELADQFDVVRDEIASVIQNHQKFRDENEKKFKQTNEKIARGIESRMGVSREPILEAIREGKVKNWDSMLNWVFRSPDSKKNNKNSELEADLFRAFPSGESPATDGSRFVMGLRSTNRNNKRGYIRDIAERDNKPESFRQLNEIARTQQSAFDGSASRWDRNERAANARFYREIARNNDVEKMWDSSITGAMASGPNMTPQEESDWKQREWKRQQLKNYALYPDKETKLPSLTAALQGDDIARAVSGLDILTDAQVDDLYDKTVEELFASGGKPVGYRAVNAPPSPRELAAAANIKRPLVKEFLDEYKSINPDGNIARLDADSMTDKEVDNFFNTFIMPGLINAGNPTIADIRASVREPMNEDSLSLAESVAFGIADEYQDLEFRTMLAKRMLKDNGISTNDPNFDSMLQEMIDGEYDKDIARGVATIEDFLDNLPHWIQRDPKELLNPDTQQPYTPDEWMRQSADAFERFLQMSEKFLDGEDIDPLEALEIQEELDRLLDVGQSNDWVDEGLRRPEYPEYMNRKRFEPQEEENVEDYTENETEDDGQDADDDSTQVEPEPISDDELAPTDEDDGGDTAVMDEDEQKRAITKLWNDVLNYPHQFGPEPAERGPSYNDAYGVLDTDEAWETFDDNGNPIPYDGSPNHPLNLNEDGTPVDVTKIGLLPSHYYRHWLANGHFLREWTEENYPGSQVARYKNLDEMSDVAVVPQEIEDAVYAGDINSPNPLDMDPNVAAGLERLIEVIAADEPGWFTRDGNGQLVGDINELTRSGRYASGGYPGGIFNAPDYTATQAKQRMKEARDAAIQQEHTDLIDNTPAAKTRRQQLWDKFTTDTLTPEEIAFDEQLFDVNNVTAALKRHAIENNISDKTFKDAMRVATTAAASRADAFTAARIQRIKDEFVAAGLQPKDWADAIDAEIANQQALKEKLDLEYSRFRSAFARKMTLVRAIFETRPPNREQKILPDGTIIPGWDRTKEPAWRYLNRIQRWDNLHFGTRKNPGPLTQLLESLHRSNIEEGQDGAAGATARIMALADRNIAELRAARNEYSRLKTQANQAGISGFMRVGGRSAEFFDSAKLNSRKAARDAAYGHFQFVPPSVLRRYDKAGLPISRKVRSSASGFNRDMSNLIGEATRGTNNNIQNNPNYKYLSPKLQRLGRIVSDFADRTVGIRFGEKAKSRRRTENAFDLATPEMIAKYDAAKSRLYKSRLALYNERKSPQIVSSLYTNGVSGAMALQIGKNRIGKYEVQDRFGRNYIPGYFNTENDAKNAIKRLEKSAPNPDAIDYPFADTVLHDSLRLRQSADTYISNAAISRQLDAIGKRVGVENDSLPKQQRGDAVILRVNPETNKREILLIDNLAGTTFGGQPNVLSLPTTSKNDSEQLRDAAKRAGLSALNADDEKLLEIENLGEIDARDWDPRFVNGALVSGVYIQVAPNAELDITDQSAKWYPLEDIANGKHPLAFGQAAWVESALHTVDLNQNELILHDKFDTLNKLSRRRQQAVIAKINDTRQFENTRKRFRNLPSADGGFKPGGADAELRSKMVMNRVIDALDGNGPISGAMGMRYIQGKITNWASDSLTKEERDKIMQDTIEARKTSLSPIWIAKKLNAKWVKDNFRRKDRTHHQVNSNQVKDILYKARLDGVTFPRLYGEIEAAPVQSAENVKLIAIRSINGYSTPDIAHELDIPVGEVARVQRAIGLTNVGGQNKVNRDRARLLELIGNGSTMRDAAKQLGLTESAANKRYKEALSSGPIVGGMKTGNEIPFKSFVKMSRDAEKVRALNAEAFYHKIYERLPNAEIAKTLGIKANEVNDAVQNHTDFIENNKNELVATLEKAFKNNGNQILSAEEKRHMKMRFDGMSLAKIAELEDMAMSDAKQIEKSAIGKLQATNQKLFTPTPTTAELALVDASITSNKGISKRVYMAVAHDGKTIQEIANIEGITPAQARKHVANYQDALENSSTYRAKMLRRNVALDNSILTDSEKQFINMRLDGASFADMAKLNNKPIHEVKLDQQEIMNKFNRGISGAMTVSRRQYKDNDYYAILGVSQDADEKELRKAYRRASKATHPDLHPGDKVMEEKFKKISEAYEVLSNPAEREYYDSVYNQQQRIKNRATSQNQPGPTVRRKPPTPNRDSQEDENFEPDAPDEDLKADPNDFTVTTTDTEPSLAFTDPVTGKRIPDWYVREQAGMPPKAYPGDRIEDDVVGGSPFDDGDFFGGDSFGDDNDPNGGFDAWKFWGFKNRIEYLKWMAEQERRRREEGDGYGTTGGMSVGKSAKALVWKTQNRRDGKNRNEIYIEPEQFGYFEESPDDYGPPEDTNALTAQRALRNEVENITGGYTIRKGGKRREDNDRYQGYEIGDQLYHMTSPNAIASIISNGLNSYDAKNYKGEKPGHLYLAATPSAFDEQGPYQSKEELVVLRIKPDKGLTTLLKKESLKNSYEGRNPDTFRLSSVNIMPETIEILNEDGEWIPLLDSDLAHGISGQMSIGDKPKNAAKLAERERRINKSQTTLDGMLADNPTKYENLKKSAVAVYNAATKLKIKPDSIIDTPDMAVARRYPTGRPWDKLEKETSITRDIKRHLQIRRMMAELLVDFSVDGNGNLKGSAKDHVSDEKNIARKKFTYGLTDAANKVIKENNLFAQQPFDIPKIERTYERDSNALVLAERMLKEGRSVDEVAEILDVSRELVGQRAKKLGMSKWRRSAGKNPKTSSTVTGAMSMFNRISGGGGDDEDNGRQKFTPVQMPKMSDVLSKRINFKGRLTNYDQRNYTSNQPRSTLGFFIARKDEPSVDVSATFGGETSVQEDRFWGLYQPVAVAISKAITKKRRDGQPKRFISVGGAPGSGKSTLRFSGKHGIPGVDAAAHIDADEMKTVIPEAIEMHRLGNPHWGDAVHEESRIMADIALKVALENGHDVVYDSTGQFNSGFGTLKAARAQGYDIVMHYNVAPNSVLRGRIDEREKQDPRRLPRHIINAVNDRNFDIMPKVASSADEFYLWDTDVPDGTEPTLLARKLKGGQLEILDAKAYGYGRFSPTNQKIDMSKPDFKLNPRKIASDTWEAEVIADYESGKSVADIARERGMSERNVFNAIIGNEIDPSIPTYRRPPVQQNPAQQGSSRRPNNVEPRIAESLSDSQAMNQFRNLSNSDKAILRDFIAKKPGVSLDQMAERVPMDLVIWASSQKPEHIQPMSQVRSIEKLESLSESTRSRLTEMLQAGESVADIATALNIPFAVIDVAMDFVDQYGYIPEGGDVEEKSATFASVSSNRKARLFGKKMKASMLNGAVINE